MDQKTGEDLLPERGREAAAKLAGELTSNPSGPGGAGNGIPGPGALAASNPLHPGMTQERLKAMEAEEEVRASTSRTADFGKKSENKLSGDKSLWYPTPSFHIFRSNGWKTRGLSSVG